MYAQTVQHTPEVDITCSDMILSLYGPTLPSGATAETHTYTGRLPPSAKYSATDVPVTPLNTCESDGGMEGLVSSILVLYHTVYVAPVTLPTGLQDITSDLDVAVMLVMIGIMASVGGSVVGSIGGSVGTGTDAACAMCVHVCG